MNLKKDLNPQCVVTQRVFLTVLSTISPISCLPNVLKANLFFDSLHDFVVQEQIKVESINHTLNLNYLPMS